ncbi:MAG: response regulator [Proteobacteria bacterium]|nr:response regulator [Pseudomonadota bacterium]
MAQTVSGGTTIHARRISLIVISAAMTMPFFSLFDRVTGVQILADYHKEFIPMAPSTAICFILIALPLLITIRPVEGPAENPWAMISGGLVALYGLLVVSGWLTGLPISPDILLFKEMATLGDHGTGGMSPVTGFLFLLSGFSLFSLIRGIPRKRHAGVWLSLSGYSGLAIMLTGILFLIGYSLGKPLLYGRSITPMALSSSFSFLFIGCALVMTAMFHGPASGRWYRTLNDMPIGIQLNLGLSVGLSLVLILGVVAWKQTDLLWTNTRTMYDHPLQVRIALGALEADILTIHRAMKDVILAKNSQEIEMAVREMETRKTNAFRQLDILYNRYLGPPSDISMLVDEFVTWNAIHDETLRLLRAGKSSEAVARTKTGGPGGDQKIVLMGHILNVEDFAQNMGDHLYQESLEQKNSLNRELFVIISSIFLIGLIISWRLLASIKNPLRQLTQAADQFGQGNMDVRCDYISANEFGVLSHMFNKMAEALEKQMRINEQSDQISNIMLRETEAHSFCRELLKVLLRLTDSQMGAIYLLNPEKTIFDHFESIGLGPGKRNAFSAVEAEGEFGAALATGKMQRVTNIPEDSRFTFATVGGDFRPKEIITMPLVVNHETSGMLSLSSIQGYTPEAVQLLEGVLMTLTDRMNGVLAFQRIQALSENLEEQNLKLQSQQEELRVSNEELEEQARQLQQSEEELKAQQEELVVTNEELEEKSDLLERQNKDIELARRNIEEKAEALALASKYKSEFLANMSHELRSPLNSLLLLALGLTRNKEGNLTEEQVESARIIYGGGSELLTLINEILDLSKIEAGRISLTFGTVHVLDLVNNLKDSFQHLADEKGIALTFRVDKDTPEVITSDRQKLEQVLRNLIANSLKFTEAGSITVTIGCPAPGTDLSISGLSPEDSLAISVKDTGIGISPELHKFIFEAFQQADGGISRKYGGTGLGLSISRELVILLGGKIHLESNTGKGSTFTAYLPLKGPMKPIENLTVPKPFELKPATLEPAIQIPDDRDSIDPSDRVMLVIEDDPIFARLLSKKCHEKGFKFLAAVTGETGLELAIRYVPQAVILDLRLPGMDGWTVLGFLKENIRTRHIPVHIISAEDASTRAMGKGAVGHVTKPVKQEDLEDAFRKLEQMAAGKPKRLLVVDDDASIRRATVALIGNGDVTADEAESGEQALAALRTGLYDCVVLDLGLPDMDGNELLSILEREGVSLPPVVVYTARDLTPKEESTIREHAESIVIKDVRSQERLLDDVSLFLHRVVSRMSEKNRKVIQDLHNTDTIFKNKKVLVVDDDMRTTFAVARLLAEAGITPLKAEHGERALKILDENPDMDLVLMDIMMPVMDGYETMQKIRAQDRFRNLPIIALTAKAMPEDREKSLAAGANDYLPKPMNQDRLFSMMRVWLNR